MHYGDSPLAADAVLVAIIGTGGFLVFSVDLVAPVWRTSRSVVDSRLGGDDANNCLHVLEKTRSEGPATFSAAQLP